MINFSSVRMMATVVPMVAAVAIMAVFAWIVWPTWQEHRALQVLLDGVEAYDPEVIEQQTEILRRRHWSGPAVPSLQRAMKNKEPRVRESAAIALGRLATVPIDQGDAAAGTTLTDSTANADALAQLGTEGLLALLDALNSDDPKMRELATELLAFLAPEAGITLAAILDAAGELDKSDTPEGDAAGEPSAALRSLTQALSSDDSRIRLLAVEALAGLGPRARSALPALIDRLEDDSKEVAAMSAQALANIGSDADSAVPTLVRLIDEQSNDVAAWFAYALWRIDQDVDHSVPALTRALEDETAEVRLLGARLLGTIGPPAQAALNALHTAMDDENEEVARESARSVMLIKPE